MIGGRIKIARRKSGYSLRSLAVAIEGRVSAQMIGKYERNESTPSSATLVALADALQVPMEYLCDARGISLTGFEFRTTANASRAERARIEVAALDWLDRYFQIEAVLELDDAQWQTPPGTPASLSRPEDAEELAERLRGAWRLGIAPVANMTELLEGQGLRVLLIDSPDQFSGLTCVAKLSAGGREVPVVAVNRNHTLERRRFTLGHELAHRLIRRDCLSRQDLEKAAMIFAGAFLMPREHLLREVGRRRRSLAYRELIDLKHIYRVSGAALLKRLRQLEVIRETTLRQAFRSFARGWRSEETEELEPSHERGRYERAMRFERLCYRGLAEDVISLIKISSLLQKDTQEVIKNLRGLEKS